MIPELSTVPIFWNRLMNPSGAWMLGLWCDAKHPALAGFPTEANCDWQWVDLLGGVRALNHGHAARARFSRLCSRLTIGTGTIKLGLLYECKVGSGPPARLQPRLEQRAARRTVASAVAAGLHGERALPAGGRRAAGRPAQAVGQHARPGLCGPRRVAAGPAHRAGSGRAAGHNNAETIIQKGLSWPIIAMDSPFYF